MYLSTHEIAWALLTTGLAMVAVGTARHGFHRITTWDLGAVTAIAAGDLAFGAWWLALIMAGLGVRLGWKWQRRIRRERANG